MFLLDTLKNLSYFLSVSSARNYFGYHRATNDSYALWADQVGDPSYRFPSFIQFFQRGVNFTTPRNDLRDANASVTYNPAAFSPSGGPLHVSFPTHANAWSSWALLALISLGFKRVPDLVSGSLLGAANFMQTVEPPAAIRSSSESSYLRKALAETSLQVYKNTLAQQVLFNTESGKSYATGVAVNTSGVLYTLSARKEVVVSAGAVGSSVSP